MSATGNGEIILSPSRIARFYGNLGWKCTDAEVHLVASEADNFFGVIGPISRLRMRREDAISGARFTFWQ